MIEFWLGRLTLLMVTLLNADVCFAAISVSSLLVEHKQAPLGIDVVPRFSWITSSDTQGTVQSSYQIRISTTAAGNSDVWDSGSVSTLQSYDIEYGGPALKSDTHYFWSVSVVTNAGTASASSEFTTGFLAASDWGTSVWITKPDPNLVPSDLTTVYKTASWIWTSEPNPPNAPAGNVAFRKTYTPPARKIPLSAVILSTADDRFTFYVNGVSVGASPDTADVWKTAEALTSNLVSGSNLFAVLAVNLADVTSGGDGPAGLLVSIKVKFTDGTSEIVSSDATWKATSTIPANFQSPQVNDSAWPNAVVQAKYGAGPWASNVAVPSTISAAPTLSVSQSNWIWSKEANPPNAPAASRAFRKTFSTPAGKTLQSAQIALTVDDRFTLYVNGNPVGSSPNTTDIWKSIQRFTVSLSGASTLFAVRGDNLADVTSGGASPAGLLCAIQMIYTDGTIDTIVSDTTWKVNTQVVDGFELPSTDDSSWSAATSLGLFGISPWNSDASISDSLAEHPVPLMRKKFTITKILSFARLYYAVGGYASFTINGAPASDRVLSPGFTKYDTETLYISVDVKSKLNSGTNAIGLELGRSHYSSTQGSVWSWNHASWVAEPSARVVLSLGYTDGTTDRVVSDASWRVTEGPTRLDDVFGGENYDASFEIPNWDTASFDDSGWQAALVTGGPAGALVNHRAPPTKITAQLTPIAVTQPVAGIYVLQFERTVAGWARISVAGPAKTLITIHYGEKLADDGTVAYQDFAHYYANNFQTDRFWLAGTGKDETFEAKFSYKGYEYVQLEGWPAGSAPSASNVVGMVVHDDLALRADFQSSSDLLNKMHRASVNTMLNNAHSYPQDCPTYEKNGWSGDAMVSAEMFLTNLDAHDFLAKYVRDLDESRPNNGPPGVIAPDSGWGQNNQAVPWHSAFILIPWFIYEYRGDSRVLKEHYAGMKNYVEFELGRSPNNIASTGLGDWDTPETSPLGGNPPEDSRIPATAFLYTILDTMSKVAAVVGQPADAATFTSQAAAVKNAFNGQFLNPSGYYSGVGDSGFRQTHNLLAIAFGLTPNNSVISTAAKAIANDAMVTKGGHLNTGALGTKHLLPVLSEHGFIDVAVALGTQTTFPSWGFWFENGANSMWEHWLVAARSHDHHFLGTFEDWLYKHVAGIKLTSPAFKTVTIAPLATAFLQSASAWTMTPFGNLSVDWHNNEGNLVVNVKVPVSVTATLILPAGNSVVTSLGQTEGVISGANSSSIVIGSGSYSFLVSS
ncbi:bacterial alpha-L-rhamnosidase-domain-containing protein [Mycena floridula]|nr:bacterial alpha-L-rhamnosidase-domain-containing protein [Mycena floridula]